MLEKRISRYWLKSIFLVVLFLAACSDSDNESPEPPINKAPTVEIVGENTVIERENISLTAQAADVDGSIASYQWTIISGENITLSGDTSAEVSFIASDVNVDTEVELNVVVTDSDGATASANHTITILRITSELTLSGMVTDSPIGNASIVITIGTDSFSTSSDNAGNYSILVNVDEDNTEKLVLLTATGSAETHPGVVLVSQLPAFSTLVAKAGESLILDRSKFFGVIINNVTTADVALIRRALNGADLENEEQLNQLLGNIDAQQKLTLAALIKIVIDEPLIDLPDGVENTFALVLDETLAQNFTNFINAQDDTLITETIIVITEDENLVSVGGENQDFDNDGVLDTLDAFPFDSTESVDTDGDGIGNNADTDDDGDGVADVDDAFPLDSTESVDTDGDGIGNNADTDDDGDGVADANDAFPLDNTESVDTDGDGIGNNADTDDDGDGVADANDAFPLDKTESVDTDGDGIGNNADTDDDGDGVADANDAFPLDSAESVDTDGDGTGNNADTDDDGDGVADANDAFPLDSAESVDTDGDGTGNNADTDDDGDGVADANDAFPLDSAESVDTDGDGTGNNADTDDDGDGVADANDAFPLDSTESVDTDGDGIGNNADTDDDGDSVADADDAYPLISVAGLVDTDLDGLPDDCDQACVDLGMHADDDDDGDGILDVDEEQPSISVAIESPQSLTTVGTSTITVSGTASPNDAILTLNGAVVANNNGSFSGEVTLKEGSNTIEIRAILGELIQSDIVTVSLDQTPPYLTIDSHNDGETVYTNTITITGLVNDIVRGTIEEDQANVTVNGLDATINNRSYAVIDVPLVEGENTITVNGADQVGNVSSIDININYEILVGKRIEVSGGQEQSAIINNELAEPLEVRVIDDNNEVVAGAVVVFRVSQGSGAVAPGTESEGRAIAVDTDANGLAATRFKVGARTGVANHKVTAAVVGYASQVDFTASASGELGNKLSVNSGNNQRGSVGNNLPEPLVVVVTDAGANVVANSRVKFQVTVGEGLLSNDQQIYEVETDSDGRASTLFQLGSLTGVDAQRVVATLIDAPEGQIITAGFSATAFVPAEAGLTKVSGVVLDNQEQPIPGVTLRIEGTTREAITDAEGQFTIEQAPIGPVHIIADGSTAAIEGEFPSLSFNLVTISGVDNPLSSPIYMVKLDTENAVYAGLADAVLELKEYPGFKLEIAKDSVTFPDGAKEGYISVTPVNAGTVPMAPPNGMQPQFIVTIQPTGTKFFPPAKLTLPNVDAHAPGAQVEMYSFDHDLEEFVAIGLGTVSEDGTLVSSNPGVGVIKAGWHCGSQPGGQSCAHNCPICQDCDGDCNCVPASGDPRLASLNTEGDCKKAECADGGVNMVNDPSDAPEDDEVGDCKKFTCEDGSPKKVTDNTDETKCTSCGPDGPEPKPDGHVPDDDKCIICQDGKETKKPDNELGGTTITFNGVKNFIADINKVLTFLGSDKKIPEVGLEYSNTKKEVCCTQQDGATTLEETDAGSVTFPRWSYSWTPLIPPWSGDYTFTVFGKSIGVTYGIRFTVGFNGKFTISRTVRECQGDNCWGGSVTGDIGVGGGPFGSVPNPASSPIACGSDNEKRPCDLIRIEGTVKTGVNVQAGVNCEKVTGTVGHNGVSLNAEVIVAEGSWVEVGASESWVIVNSANIAIIDIALPN